MDNELLVKSVRDLCKKNNMTPSQLENELKFGAGLISRWAKSSPSIDKVIEIANRFQVTLDEVVGRNQNINDEFLSTLYSSTENKQTIWLPVNEVKDYPVSIILEMEEYNEDIYTVTQYCTRYRNSCIIIYCYHKYNRILQPITLSLYIQTSQKGEVSLQPYDKEELKPLWIKILNSLDEHTPAEVKAEDLKKKFIHDFKITPQTSNSNLNEIESLSKLEGCILYDLISCKILYRDARTGYTSAAEEFYEQYKDALGEVKQAQMIKGCILFFISETKIMKFSGLSCGKYTGMKGYNGFLRVMEQAGFDISDESVFAEDNFTLYK